MNRPIEEVLPPLDVLLMSFICVAFNLPSLGLTSYDVGLACLYAQSRTLFRRCEAYTRDNYPFPDRVHIRQLACTSSSPSVHLRVTLL